MSHVIDQKPARLARPAWMIGIPACDWPEDAEHENGQYFCKCSVPGCGADFIGHKRRHVCRSCHMLAKAKYDAMSKKERAIYDQELAKQIAILLAARP